jgi:hypothetical protein
MKRLLFPCVLLLVLILASGCAMQPPTKPVLTPLEIQSLQTREYESTKDIVFASTMSVFQDLGYTIVSADKHTGFITAESAARSDAGSRMWLNVSNVSQTSATAFVEEIAKRTRVRLNFVTRNMRSYEYGQSDRDDTPILNPMTYQNAFDRIETEIFVRSPD